MKKGHKKIGMITGPDNVYTARERQRGYKLALQESSKAQSEQQSDLKDKTDRKDTKLLADGNYTIAGGAKASRYDGSIYLQLRDDSRSNDGDQ